MKWYHYIICFALIVVGVFCSIELVDMFNKKSQEFGTAITIETKNDYEEISKFDYGSIEFDTEDYVNFTNISVFEPIQFDGKDKNYLLLLNSQPANNIVLTNGKISGDITLSFYNLDGTKATTAKLNVVIEYYASQTKVTITTKNENDSVAYLTTYMEINGAVLKVVERG